jgi:ribosomal-protein-alanine N-acetyltransferase
MNTGIITPTEIVRMREIDITSVLEILTENKLENWSYNDLFSEIQRDDSILLVVVFQKEIIGFCIARLIRLENITTDLNNKNNIQSECKIYKNECEIYNIAVKKKYQKRGIGRQMLNKIVLLATEQQSQSIWLEVRNSNFKAINFYQSNSFRQMYKRKNFYSNPSEDAIVMKRNLK